MLSEPIVFAAVALVSLTSVYNLISRDWRTSIGCLALQYVGVFLLVKPPGLWKWQSQKCWQVGWQG